MVGATVDVSRFVNNARNSELCNRVAMHLRRVHRRNAIALPDGSCGYLVRILLIVAYVSRVICECD